MHGQSGRYCRRTLEGLICLGRGDNLSKPTKRVCGPLAQPVEQLTFNQWVGGSCPSRATTMQYVRDADFMIRVSSLWRYGTR